MSKKLFVGNLSFSTTDDVLSSNFSEFGTITSANVIVDKFSGRSKGFGFVEFENDAEADAAVAAMNGKEIDGRALTVNEARPLEPRNPRQ